MGQHHGDLKPALLEAALALVADGHEGFSLREVARRAGVSPAAPYHHFPDKDSLLAAVAEEGFVALDKAIEKAIEKARNPISRLERMGSTYVRFAITHHAHYRTMFAPSLKDKQSHPTLEAAARHSFVRLARAYAAALPHAGEAELRRRAGLAWALAHGAVELAADEMYQAATGEQEIERIAASVGQAMVLLAAEENA
ncbi:MAG: TetR/AcrR family transcriptional regulator [Myxococcota bacterium]